MAGIFISYRRADSDGWAGRLRDALRNRFGDLVFQDVDNIPDGEIFSDVIDRALKECDVALIIIGPNWANAVDEKGRRRLDQEDDWVRTETSMVLNRKIRVIPVLVGGARLPPPDELPADLRSLTRRQAREIRSTSWDSDVALLTSHLKQIVRSPHGRKVWLYAVPALLVLLGIGVYSGRHYFGEGPSSPTPAPHAAAPAPASPPQREAAPVVKAPEPVTSVQAPEALPPPPAKIVEAPPPKPKPSEVPPSAKAPEPPRPAPAKQAFVEPQLKPQPSAKPPVAKPSVPQPEQPRIASREPPPAAPPVAKAPAQEPRRPAPTPEPEAPAERAAAPPPVAPKSAAATAARSAALNLPNRPASARELKVGDSWTYKLRDVRFGKELATVTHEIGGGDSGGIRETVRLGGRRAAADSDPDSGGARASVQRRLPLEPRMFEQTVDREAVLFEFAPFMSAFSDLQAGLRWSKIAAANNSSWGFSGKIVGRETVRVPAGTFEAIKAELEGQADVAFPSTRDTFNEIVASYQTYSIWFVPEIGRAVKYERRTYNRSRRILEHEQYELQSYQLK